MPRPTPVTQILSEAAAGDATALDRLMPLVYDELRSMAHRHLRSEHGGRTLQTTALVHEAYFKLAGGQRLPADSRAHFFGAASRAMRQVLVDYARKRTSAKRGGDAERVSLDDSAMAVDACSEDLLALDQALTQLAEYDQRMAQIVECHFFGGLPLEQAAEVVGVSYRTAKRDWRKAKAWLYHRLSDTAPLVQAA